VLRCPREVAPFLRDILSTAVAFMKYDPNYAYDSEGEEGNGSEGDRMSVDGEEGDEGNGSEEDYGEEEGGGGSDDDDTSWKVRKAAVKVIAAVVQARPDLLGDTWGACGPQLVRRFKEREENVRLDILACFTAIVQASYVSNTTGPANAAPLHHAPPSPRSSGAALTKQRSSSGDFTATGLSGAGTGRGGRSTLPQLGAPKVVQSIVTACTAQLTGPSAKSKSAVFVLLRALVITLNVSSLLAAAVAVSLTREPFLCYRGA
jgi:cullin-associated NEDD8-dissociated protein 1